MDPMMTGKVTVNGVCLSRFLPRLSPISQKNDERFRDINCLTKIRCTSCSLDHGCGNKVKNGEASCGMDRNRQEHLLGS
jgi:hypothetical protein